VEVTACSAWQPLISISNSQDDAECAGQVPGLNWLEAHMHTCRTFAAG